MKMEKVKECSKRFMEKEYADEASYFDIAWEVYQEVREKEENANQSFEPPVVRLEGDDTIMAPMVIKAFHFLYSKLGEEIESSENTANLRSSMMKILSENNFSREFSTKVIDFLLENADES